jgi:predicted acyl esterase
MMKSVFLLSALTLAAQTVVSIPLRDGAALAGDLYLPKAPGKHPTVVIQTPYNKDLIRPWFRGEGRFGAKTLFTREDFAFLVTDWRGRFASRAAQRPGRQLLGEDGFDTLAWVARQEWSNGKVGTWGPSALGRAQYETARANPPALVCAVPMVMPLNLRYEDYYPGGVLWKEFVDRLVGLGFPVQLVHARPLKDAAWEALEPNYVKGSDIRVPALLVGGWFDIYTDGVIAAFEEIRRTQPQARLLMGPWIHATDGARVGDLEFANARNYSVRRAEEFFESCLLGKPRPKVPAVEYYVLGVNEWRTADQWPPRRSQPRAFHLTADRALSRKKARPFAVKLPFDPANPVPTVGGHVLDQSLNPGPRDLRAKVESHPGAVTFSTPPLGRDLAALGKIRVELDVAASAPDADVSVILADVFPDGRSMQITEGIRRLSLRNGPSKAEPLEPGRIYPVTVELTHTAIVFQKGHRIRLVVAGSNHPKHALNPAGRSEITISGGRLLLP